MVIVLMGVAGAGKTTIGQKLSSELGWKFYDADDYHTRASIEKMKHGLPLNDADREPWLEILRALIRDCLEHEEDAVLACSALRKSYRDFLLIDERVKLIYLKGSYELIQERLRNRVEHFMKPSMLDSQFDALEEPEPSAHLDASQSQEEIIKEIRSRLGK
jgi:carbohydrate kinase, thermoresistant glucokinase family